MIRKYNITDKELLSFIYDLIVTIKSNISDFSIYNIDIDKMNEFYDAANSFERNMYDIDYLYYSVDKNKTKNDIKALLIEQFKDNLTRVSVRFGKNSEEYSNFAASGINAFTEDELITASRRAHYLMGELAAELAEVGLTPAMIAAFNDLINQFEEARNITIKANSTRVEKTKERIAEANALYDMTRNYAEIGKRVYKNKSSIQYKWFLMPRNTPKGLKTPPVLSFDAENMLLRWDAIEEATSYQLQKHNGVKFVEIYSGSNNFYKIKQKGERAYYRIRARNSKGFGAFSDEYEIKNNVV